MSGGVNRKAVEERVRGAWEQIVDQSGVREEALDALPKGEMRLLGSSVKTEKGVSEGVMTAVQYLAPARESGRQVCPFASAGCKALCLGHSSGRMAMSASERARLWKTTMRFGATEEYFALLGFEIEAHRRRAEREGMIPAVRLDGSSDLGDAEIIAEQHPDVVFYDYTKSLARMRRVWRNGPLNYHLTFSYSGENWAECEEVLREGYGSVAVVFDVGDADLPEEWCGYPVIDGDKHDARFLDDARMGVIVGLRAKGKARGASEREENCGFVVPVSVVQVREDV